MKPSLIEGTFIDRLLQPMGVFMRRMSHTVLVAAACLLSGCMFKALKEDLAKLDALATVQGSVAGTIPSDVPVRVVLMKADTDDVLDAFTLVRAGSYFFVVPPGTYRVGAFLDSNNDLRLGADERSAWHGAPSPVKAVAGQTTKAIDIDLDAAGGQRMTSAVGVPAKRDVHNLPELELGVHAAPDDERFSAANADLGLWQPVEFVTKGLPGIYFLDEYDADKIPVLFVHGAHGTPNDWRVLAPRIDRERFQAWLVYYPSGVRIETAARGILRGLAALHTRYPFRQLVIVAHSMGGIVARTAINQWFAQSSGPRLGRLERFITLSTPWEGHAAAAWGVKNAPAVVPSWIDMQPGSELLSGLYDRALPEECEYNLLFGFGGGSGLYSEPNDGAVTLSSQLRPAAQEAAKLVRGFHESHTSILVSEAAVQTVNEILSGVE